MDLLVVGEGFLGNLPGIHICPSPERGCRDSMASDS
jgi:hypothetical protein